jgi:sugar phosphate permease
MGSSVPRRRWRIAFLLAFGVLVNFFDRINLSVSREALHDSFGLSLVAFGYLSSAFSWTYAILQMPCGVLLDRWGVRRVGRISAFLWSISSFAAAIAPGLTWFFSARLLLGVSEAPTFPANAKALGYWFTREERSLATAITDAAAKFSSAIGVPLIGLCSYISAGAGASPPPASSAFYISYCSTRSTAIRAKTKDCRVTNFNSFAAAARNSKDRSTRAVVHL